MSNEKNYKKNIIKEKGGIPVFDARGKKLGLLSSTEGFIPFTDVQVHEEKELHNSRNESQISIFRLDHDDSTKQHQTKVVVNNRFNAYDFTNNRNGMIPIINKGQKTKYVSVDNYKKKKNHENPKYDKISNKD